MYLSRTVGQWELNNVFIALLLVFAICWQAILL